MSGFDRQVDRDGRTLADLVAEELGLIADELVRIRRAVEIVALAQLNDRWAGMTGQQIAPLRDALLESLAGDAT